MHNRQATKLKSAALWLVGFHFLTVVLHSVAHEVLSVRATLPQLAFIIPTIILAPLVAASMLQRFKRAGAMLLLFSMLGSFFFGLYYHFVADTFDHVSHVARLRPASWSALFRVTAYLLLASELLGSALAWLSLAGQSQSFKHYATRRGF